MYPPPHMTHMYPPPHIHTGVWRRARCAVHRECPRRGPEIDRDPYMGRGEQRSSVPPGGGGGGEGGAKRQGGVEVRTGRGSELYLNWPMMSHIRHRGPK